MKTTSEKSSANRRLSIFHLNAQPQTDSVVVNASCRALHKVEQYNKRLNAQK